MGMRLWLAGGPRPRGVEPGEPGYLPRDTLRSAARQAVRRFVVGWVCRLSLLSRRLDG